MKPNLLNPVFKQAGLEKRRHQNTTLNGKFFQGFFQNRCITSVITLEQQTCLTRFVNFFKVFFKIAVSHPLLH